MRLLTNLMWTSVMSAGAALAFSEASVANVHEYRIRWVPFSQETCVSEVQEIANRLSVVTGRAVVGVGCERPFSWLTEAVIQYAGDTPLRLISTFSEYVSEQGFYRTMADCHRDLDAVTQRFRTQTLLEPVAAFCYSETTSPSPEYHPYVARVDGFGEPALRPFVFKSQLYENPRMAMSELQELFEQSLSGMADVIAPRVIVTRDSALRYRITAQYYATRKRPLSLVDEFKFESLEACVATAPLVKSVLESLGASALTSFCAEDLSGFSEYPDVFPLYTFGLVTGAFRIDEWPHGFATRDACEVQQNQILDVMRSDQDVDAVAVICSFESTSFGLGPYAHYAKVLIRL